MVIWVWLPLIYKSTWCNLCPLTRGVIPSSWPSRPWDAHMVWLTLTWVEITPFESPYDWSDGLPGFLLGKNKCSSEISCCALPSHSQDHHHKMPFYYLSTVSWVSNGAYPSPILGLPLLAEESKIPKEKQNMSKSVEQPLNGLFKKYRSLKPMLILDYEDLCVCFMAIRELIIGHRSICRSRSKRWHTRSCRSHCLFRLPLDPKPLRQLWGSTVFYWLVIVKMIQPMSRILLRALSRVKFGTSSYLTRLI